MGFEIEITVRELIFIATGTFVFLTVLGLIFLVNDSDYINAFFEGKEESLITSIISLDTRIYKSERSDLQVYSKNPHYLESQEYNIYFYSLNRVVQRSESGREYFEVED